MASYCLEMRRDQVGLVGDQQRLGWLSAAASERTPAAPGQEESPSGIRQSRRIAAGARLKSIISL